jgi:hypothetical protein
MRMPQTRMTCTQWKQGLLCSDQSTRRETSNGRFYGTLDSLGRPIDCGTGRARQAIAARLSWSGQRQLPPIPGFS